MPNIPLVTEVTHMASPGAFEEHILAGSPQDPPRDPRFHDVVIRAPGVDGMGASILLDGVPLRGVRSYSVRVGYTEVSEVTVTFLAGSVNRLDDAEHPAGPA